jgi:hypothetical protein
MNSTCRPVKDERIRPVKTPLGRMIGAWTGGD